MCPAQGNLAASGRVLSAGAFLLVLCVCFFISVVAGDAVAFGPRGCCPCPDPLFEPLLGVCVGCCACTRGLRDTENSPQSPGSAIPEVRSLDRIMPVHLVIVFPWDEDQQS